MASLSQLLKEAESCVSDDVSESLVAVVNKSRYRALMSRMAKALVRKRRAEWAPSPQDTLPNDLVVWQEDAASAADGECSSGEPQRNSSTSTAGDLDASELESAFDELLNQTYEVHRKGAEIAFKLERHWKVVDSPYKEVVEEAVVVMNQLLFALLQEIALKELILQHWRAAMKPYSFRSTIAEAPAKVEQLSLNADLMRDYSHAIVSCVAVNTAVQSARERLIALVPFAR